MEASMACSPSSKLNNEKSDSAASPSSSSSTSHYLRTVLLNDWWLIKADKDSHGKWLAVAGSTSPDQQAVRTFSSAPILKRLDVFTLETVDGVIVILKGFINKLRTTENGFPAEVFGHFVFGFPFHWEQLVEKFFEGASTNEDVSRSSIHPENLRTVQGSCDDFHNGTPGRNKKALGKSTHTDWENKVVSQTGGCANFQEGAPNGNQKIYSNSGVTTCDKMDSSQAGADDFPEGSPSRNRKAVAQLWLADSDNMESSKADGQSKNRESILRRSSRSADTNQKNSVHTEDCKKETRMEKASNWRKKTRRKLTYSRTPATFEGTHETLPVSPDLLNLRKSRSGRILLPALEFWRNQTAVYDKDRNLTGIQERLPDAEQLMH